MKVPFNGVTPLMLITEPSTSLPMLTGILESNDMTLRLAYEQASMYVDPRLNTVNGAVTVNDWARTIQVQYEHNMLLPHGMVHQMCEYIHEAFLSSNYDRALVRGIVPFLYTFGCLTNAKLPTGMEDTKNGVSVPNNMVPTSGLSATSTKMYKDKLPLIDIPTYLHMITFIYFMTCTDVRENGKNDPVPINWECLVSYSAHVSVHILKCSKVENTLVFTPMNSNNTPLTVVTPSSMTFPLFQVHACELYSFLLKTLEHNKDDGIQLSFSASHSFDINIINVKFRSLTFATDIVNNVNKNSVFTISSTGTIAAQT
jgi:hypothetical protein